MYPSNHLIDCNLGLSVGQCVKTLATCSGAEWTWWLTVPYPTVNFGFSECQAVSCYYCLIFAIVFFTGSVTLGSCCPSFRCQPIRSTNSAGKLNSKVEKATINLSNIRMPLSTNVTSNNLVKLNGIDASKYCVILILCQFPVFFRYVIGRSSWIRPRCWIMRIGKGDPRKSRNIYLVDDRRGVCAVCLEWQSSLWGDTPILTMSLRLKKPLWKSRPKNSVQTKKELCVQCFKNSTGVKARLSNS